MEISTVRSTGQQDFSRRRFIALSSGSWLATLLARPMEIWAATHNISPSITGFSAADKRRVEQALTMALDRCFNPKVIKLAGKNTYRSRGPAHDSKDWNYDFKYRRGQEAEEAIKYYAVLAMAPMLRRKQNGSCDFSINIAAANLTSGVGQATVGLNSVWGYHANDNNSRPRYSIELHKRAVGERPIDATAGTIFHEMLHNAGLSHGSGGTHESDYAGYLIKEWGLAIASNGEEGGFGLVGDPWARQGCG